MSNLGKFRRGEAFSALKKWRVLKEIEWCPDQKSRQQTMKKYELSPEEVLEWREKLNSRGRLGLLATRSGKRWAL